MNNIQLEKLDGRHGLSSIFSHRAKLIGTSEVPNWIEIRNWLWENYGPGLEYETVWTMHYHDGSEPKWAWRINDRRYYIYLKEEVLTHFSLKYLNT